MIRNGSELKIENTNLNLSTIFENYEYLSDNCLDLSSFVKDFNQNETAKWKEENNQIIMTTSQKEIEKELRIDRMTGKPQKLSIKWANKKTGIYILYNEVNINS